MVTAKLAERDAEYAKLYATDADKEADAAAFAAANEPDAVAKLAESDAE